MTDIYFAYSVHRTRAAAEAALAQYYANGEVCEAERPRIERRRMSGSGFAASEDAMKAYMAAPATAWRYCVMFPG